MTNHFLFFLLILGSLWDLISLEFKSGCSLEYDEEEFLDKREKVYTFMKIPLEIERFMLYGICQVYNPQFDFTIVKHSV